MGMHHLMVATLASFPSTHREPWVFLQNRVVLVMSSVPIKKNVVYGGFILVHGLKEYSPS